MTSPKTAPKVDIDFRKSVLRFATWYDTNKGSYESFADAVAAYFREMSGFTETYLSKAKTPAQQHFAQCMVQIRERIFLIISDCELVKSFEAFAEQLAEEFDLFASIAFSSGRYKPDTGLDTKGEDDAIEYLLSKAQPYVVHLSDGTATGGPCTLFGDKAEPVEDRPLPDKPPLGFSFSCASKPVARAQYEKKSINHKGLPTLVISMNQLPPRMFTVVLEILARQGVCGLSFTDAGKRDNSPDGDLGLRSFHQNEMGLLPAAAIIEGKPPARCQAYHELFVAEGADSLQGKQKNKGIDLEETCLFEFNARGFNDTNVRLVYDSSRDQVYLTFHYQVMLIEKPEGKPLTCVKFASNADTLLCLGEPRPAANKMWISSMILINVPEFVKLKHIAVPVTVPVIVDPDEGEQDTQVTVDSGKGRKDKQVAADSGKAKKKPVPFPLMPVTPAYAKTATCVSVSELMLQSAAKAAQLKCGKGSDANIVIIEKVRTSMFDLHLSCVMESGVADTFHLAIRTNGRHGSVLYWWFRLVWTNAPTVKKFEKNQTFARPELQWQFDGPINGHGASRYTEMWDDIKVYGDLIDGSSVLVAMLKALLARDSKIVVVKKQVAGKGEAEVYFQLQR